MAPKPGAVSISVKGSGPEPVLRPAVNRPVRIHPDDRCWLCYNMPHASRAPQRPLHARI